MNAENVMKLIEDERKRQGMGMKKLANKIGVCPSNVMYWEHGGGITLEKADLALKALGISATIGTEEGR